MPGNEQLQISSPPNTNEHCQPLSIQYATTQPGLHGHIDWTMPGRAMADGGEEKPQTIN